MSTITIKAKLRNDLRRFKLSSKFSLEELKERLQQTFELEGKEYKLLYTDDEGDEVTIANQDDLAEAKGQFVGAVLRITVVIPKARGKTRPKKASVAPKKAKPAPANNNNNTNNNNVQMPGLHQLLGSLGGMGGLAGLTGAIGPMLSQALSNPQLSGMLGGLLNGSDFLKVEHNHICDSCDKPIRGDRLHCSVCPDFDLCRECHSKGARTIGNHLAHHSMETVTAQDALLNALKNGGVEAFFERRPCQRNNSNCAPKKESKGPYMFAVCDNCDERIYGMRAKCAVCPDFDLCGDCLAKGNKTIGEHKESHHLHKITEPHVRQVPQSIRDKYVQDNDNSSSSDEEEEEEENEHQQASKLIKLRKDHLLAEKKQADIVLARQQAERERLRALELQRQEEERLRAEAHARMRAAEAQRLKELQAKRQAEHEARERAKKIRQAAEKAKRAAAEAERLRREEELIKQKLAEELARKRKEAEEKAERQRKAEAARHPYSQARDTLIQMGFSSEDSLKALIKSKGDLLGALQSLLRQ